MKIFKTVILFVFLFLFCLENRSQQYDFRIYREEQGLAQSYVYVVHQKLDGFVAVGTGGGLSITSGAGFSTYTNKEGLEENMVTSLAEDQEGTLWVGHFMGGISFIKNNKAEVFTPYTREMKRVNALFAHLGRIWIGNSDDDLYYAEKGKLKKTPLPGSKGINAFSCGKNNIFAATGNGIYSVQIINEKIIVQHILATQGKVVTAICAFRDSVIYFATAEGEFFRIFQTAGGKFSMPEFFYRTKNPVVIKSILVNSENVLWAATFGQGLLRFDLNPLSSIINSPYLIGESNGLLNEDITCLTQDRDRNLWIGTYGGGIYLLPHKSFLSFNRRVGLMDEDVLSVAQVGRFLFSGCRSGFQVCDFPGGTNPVFYSAKNGFVDDEVKTIGILDSSTLVLGTRNYGAFYFDLVQGKFSKIKISSSGINHVLAFGDTLLIFSTIDGLILFNPKNNSETKYTTEHGLPHNMILQTAIDAKNRIWIAARQSQLTCLEKGKISIVRDNNIFNSFNITSLLAAPDGYLYFGTSGNGLFRYDGKTFYRKSEEEGLTSNFITGLVFDEVNRMVICTHPNGISNWNLETDFIRSRNSRNQTPAFENRPNAVFHEFGSGKMFFGNAQGISYFNSGKKPSKSLPPTFHFTAIVANEKNFPVDSKRIELEAGEYDIRLEYAGISFPESEEVSYQYQMEGLGNKPRSTFSRVLEFPSLHEGEYALKIFSRTADGIRNPEEYTLEIMIKPPTYKQPWFIVTEVFALLLVFWGIFRIRIVTLKKANLRLEERVNEKTRKIEEDKNVIQQMNVDLKNKNDEITAGIEYAKRIQFSLLPRPRQIQSRLDSVLFYLPRDIVSGDFYWFRETENYFYLGAADCTGHGVSGAFMSIIGVNLLDRFLDESIGDELPSDLLRELNAGVVSLLKQKNADAKLKDGMDIALCRMKKDKTQMIFSGAARPLYLIRDNKFEEFSTAPYPVGGYLSAAEKIFTDLTIDLQKGDVFYLFSDGFADQFGGPNQKRYSKKRFAEFIHRLSSLPIQDQKSCLLKEFKSWKGTATQQDDVLVFGVRI